MSLRDLRLMLPQGSFGRGFGITRPAPRPAVLTASAVQLVVGVWFVEGEPSDFLLVHV